MPVCDEEAEERRVHSNRRVQAFEVCARMSIWVDDGGGGERERCFGLGALYIHLPVYNYQQDVRSLTISSGVAV